MARGIDSIGQEAALLAGGYSISVLGCGVDICYPRENRALYERCLSQGTLLSEYRPGTAPAAGNFPPRNRIISGLSDAVVVVEAKERSGTLITVDMALEQGREVYVVPGRITDSLSAGCNRLIGQGAQLLLSPSELVAGVWAGRGLQKPLEEKEKSKVGGMTEENRCAFGTGTVEALLYHACDAYPRPLYKLTESVKNSKKDVTQQEILKALMNLVIAGDVKEKGKNYYYRVRVSV